MVYQYPKTIKEAAEILDKDKPGWAKLITKPIYQNNVEKCILGQLYSNSDDDGYHNGLSHLFASNIYDNKKYQDEIFGSQASKETWQKEIDQRLKGTTMKFGEAMQALADGHKIRVIGWTDGSYYELMNNNIVNSAGKTINNGATSPFFYKDENWEIMPTKLTFKGLKKGDKFTGKSQPEVLTKCSSPLGEQGWAIRNGHEMVRLDDNYEVVKV